MKTGFRIALALVGATLLVGAFSLVIGARIGGFRGNLGPLIAAAALPVPLLAGYLTPGRDWMSALGFALVTLMAVVIATALAPVPFWPESVWDLDPDTRQVFRAYIVLGCLISLAGSWLRRASLQKRWWRLAPLALTLGALCSGLAAMAHLRQYGLLPFAHGGRVASYERLWHNLDRYYAHWETAPVAPAELRARYRTRINAADQACGWWGRCAPYHAAIRDMLAELRDGHTHVLPRHELWLPELAIQEIEGNAVIVSVEPGSAAERSGLRPGMVLRSVDGHDTEHALARVPAHALAYTAAHKRSFERHRLILAGPASAAVVIEVDNLSGSRQTFTLERTSRPDTSPSRVRGRRLEHGLAYISVSAVKVSDVVPQFDALLDAMADVSGLVLDLRGNGGGWSMYGDAIAGRLLTQQVHYGKECFRGGHPLANYRVGCFKRWLSPRQPVYSGPLAVLLDAGTASSAETMALALCSSGRARCFGRRTAGDGGNPQPHFLPGAMLQYSCGEFTRPDGVRLNGHGVEPQVRVRWTLHDLSLGRDPDLLAALRWLGSGPASP